MTKAALLNWKKNLPKDWEIKEWNEKNIPMEIPFIKHWYEKKNYSFIFWLYKNVCCGKIWWCLHGYWHVYSKTNSPKMIKWRFLFSKVNNLSLWYFFLIAKKNNPILKILLEIYRLPLFTYKNNHNKLYHSLLITQVLKDLYGKKNKEENVHLGKFYIIGHNKVNLDMDDGENVIKHFYGESWFPNSWDPNVKISDVKEGRYYFVEKALYQNNKWIIFKYKIFGYL